MDLMALLNQVKDAIYRDPTTPHQPNNDPSGLIGQIEGLFGQHQQRSSGMNVRPASEDPYGDPALQSAGTSYGYLEGQNVRPASEDPLGDPADQEGITPVGNYNNYNQNAGGTYRNVRPASEDPLGDPADN
jgi:hypothetical protein